MEETPPSFGSELNISNALKKKDTSEEVISSHDEDVSSDELSDYEEYCKIEDLYTIYIVNGSVYKLYSLFDDEKVMNVLFPNKASYQDCVIRAIELLTIAKMSSIESGNERKLCQARFYKYIQQIKECRS